MKKVLKNKGRCDIMKVKSNTIVKDGEIPMANELVSPKIDVVFKKVFGEEDILG